MAIAQERIHELTHEEALELLDKQAQRYFKMSAQDFVAAWQEGKFKGQAEDPAVVRLAMLLPLLRK